MGGCFSLVSQRLSVTLMATPLSSRGEGMNSLRLKEGGLSGFSGAGPRDPGSARTFLSGGGGTTNSSGTVSDPSSAIPSNTGEACPEKNYIMVIHECIKIRILMSETFSGFTKSNRCFHCRSNQDSHTS